MNQSVVHQIQRASHRNNAMCHSCPVIDVCFPKDQNKRRSFGHALLNVKKHEPIYRVGDDCRYIYTVRSGGVKTVKTTHDGLEQVIGVYLPGEVFGFDGMASGKNSVKAVALDNTSICQMPTEIFRESIENMNKLVQLIGEDYSAYQSHLMMINKNPAEVRVASLLLDIATRMCKGKLDNLTFKLMVTRADMANYLGLTVETVSRLLRRMHREGILNIKGRTIEILDLDRLQQQAFF